MSDGIDELMTCLADRATNGGGGLEAAYCNAQTKAFYLAAAADVLAGPASEPYSDPIDAASLITGAPCAWGDAEMSWIPTPMGDAMAGMREAMHR